MQLKNDKFTLEITRNPSGKLQKEEFYYHAQLLSGEWPSNDKLINLIDPLNLGGRVQNLTETTKQVTVYVD